MTGPFGTVSSAFNRKAAAGIVFQPRLDFVPTLCHLRQTARHPELGERA
jgi:hypothetical protein